jgi:DNA-binding CsgD family transcriptional regulator
VLLVFATSVAMMAHDLIDSIYEAAAVPTLWPVVLGRISDRVEGNGGVLVAARDGYDRLISSPDLADVADKFMSDGWATRDPRLPRAVAVDHPGFVNDSDLFTDEEIETNEVYADFFRPHGIGYMAGTLIHNPSGDFIAVVVERHQNNGPVPRETVAFLDTLRPHLARASMLAFRIGFEQARAQAEALQAMGLPAAVLRHGGSVLAANPLFEGLIPAVAQDRRHRVVLTNGNADALLATALAQHRAGGPITGPASIPIPAEDNRPPMIVHLVPVHGAAHDIFSQSAMLLLITPVDRAAVPTAEVLQGLFDLTPAEARVAKGIGLAQPLEMLAASQGVSRETVRSQLKQVLAKTGLSRQVELVSLLAGRVI